MSINQSRADKSESSQYKRLDRSGSSGQQRNLYSGSGKGGGGGTGPPPSSSSSLSSNRSFRKSNNAQGGPSRASGSSLTSDSNNASSAYTVQNSAHAQTPLHGATVKPTNVSTQRGTRVVPKIPSSNATTVSSDTKTPTTPAKGDASRSYPLQFGSINPGFMNGMQIPARTSSAPPNLDEQKRDQVRHLSAAPSLPTPSIPKQQLPRKDAGTVGHSNSGEVRPMTEAKRDVQVSAAPPTTHTQKSSVHPMPGISMHLPFLQPQVPVQFGGPNPQIQSQGMTATSLPMPLSMGNPPQMQQQVFIPGLQPHPMQSQGIMHQGQTINFSSQLGPHMPPQLGNLGRSITPQFPQQQAGKFAAPRRTVKITHPETHEELSFEKSSDTHIDSGSSGPRSHHNVPPQSQPLPSYPPGHPSNYYSNAYNSSSLYFPSASSISNQITLSSQAPRFYNQVSQGPPTVSFMNPSTLNSFSVNKTGVPLHGVGELSNMEYSRDVHTVSSSPPSTSVQVTVKPAVALHGEKVVNSSLSVSLPAGEKGEPPKVPRSDVKASMTYPQRDSKTSSQNTLQQSKPGLEPTSASMHVSSKQSTAIDDSVSPKSSVPNFFSFAPAPSKDSASLPTSITEGTQRETVSRSDSVNDEQTKPGKKGHSLPQNQVGGKSTSVSSLPSRSLEHGDSLNGKIAETLEAKLAPASSDTTGVTLENPRDSLANIEVSSGASDLKTNHAGEGMTGESLETEVIINTSLKDEQPKPETVGRKAKAEIMLSERSEQENSFETSSESSEVIAQTEQSSVQKVTTNNYEAGSLETAQRKVEEHIFGCREDDRVAGNLVTYTSTVSDAIDAEASLSSLSLSTNSHGNNTSTLDAFVSRHDSMDSKEVAGTESGLLDQKSAPVSVSSPPEPTKEVEGESTENISTGLVSPSASGSKVNPLLEPNKAKNTMAKGKKKKKEILQKADAAGTTSDLYMAYKGPEEKKETVTSAESISSYSLRQEPADATRKDFVSSEKDDQSKTELDDWEDAADISTPKLEISDNGKQVHGGLNHHGEDGNGVMAKRYSRDFLLKFAEQCIEPPKGFEITSDLAEVLMVSNTNVSRDSYPSPGRIIDRPTGGSRPDRRGSGMGDDDRWSKQPGSLASGRDMQVDIGCGGNVVGFQPGQGGNFGVLRKPRAQAPVQYAGGILSGPMQSLVSQGGMQRNNSDSDRWQRATAFQKGLIPSPHTPLLAMHKAEKKYEVGKVSDEEEAKQRQLKGILNKLTPQNFEKLFEQVKQVNIDNDVTLNGVISQIFDKALMEPTFCEMYANFCYYLAGELPDLSVGNEKITFKRLLLNKCQEEFERGVREQEEANKAEEEGEAKRSEEEREEIRIRARRRMLGNIRLIGELYKKKMLTERIMHECIKKLLGQSQNPDEEDVEALCKLMSTIGEMIDHPKAKEHMDAYFDMMVNLSNNMKLSSRTRFMLKDAIDLRKNKWQQRRKVEGPKKIEEVHRDAAQERQAQVSRLARAPNVSSSVRRSQPMEFAPRGSNILSSRSAQMGGLRGVSPQLHGYGNQDVRWENKHILSVPLPQRPVGDDSITLGPQGGLARGMSSRGQPSMPNISLADVPSPGDSRRMTAGTNGYSSVPERIPYGSREAILRQIPDRLVSPSAYDQSSTLERNINYGNRHNTDLGLDRSLPNLPPTRGWEPTFTQNVSSEMVWPEERLRDMSLTAIKGFYSANDEKEVAQCIKDLNAPSFYSSMISIWVTDSFERKDMERDLLAKLLINLTKSRDCMISPDQLIGGFESVLTTLEDAVNDAPKATEYLGRIFAKVILENVIPLTEIGRLIYVGGEEEGRLVETGLAAEILGSILEIIKSEGGDTVLNEILRTSANLRLENFRLPGSKKSMGLDKFI